MKISNDIIYTNSVRRKCVMFLILNNLSHCILVEENMTLFSCKTSLTTYQ